ncbi:MAG: hypothetical protein HKM05_02405 [Spirochaetales bacterium]|nr:hypothetical protein [Spirochaetales bacterium]
MFRRTVVAIKVTLTMFLSAVVFTSCSQVFDGNLFHNVDPPAAPDASALQSASVTEIRNLTQQPGFYSQLQSNPGAEAAVATNLVSVISSPSSSTSDKLLAEQTLIQVATYGTNTGTVVSNVLNSLTSLTSSNNLSTLSSPTTALSTAQSLFAGQTPTQIASTLNNLVAISNIYTALNTTSGGNSTDFFGTTNKTDLAQIGAVAAVANVLVAASGGSTTTAAQFIATGNTALINTTTLSTQATDLANAFNNTTNSGTYSYITTMAPTLKF